MPDSVLPPGGGQFLLCDKKRPVDIAVVVESAGRKVTSRILDISERGAKVTCVPALAMGAIGKIMIEGMQQPLTFVVRGGTHDSSSREFKIEDAHQPQHRNWPARVTARRAAA